MSAFLLYLQSAPSVSTEAWELAKGVMLTLSTLGVGYLVRTVRGLEMAVSKLQTVVSSDDGLKNTSGQHSVRLTALEAWRIKAETAEAIEREQYQGDERRQELRRIRDRILADVNPLDTGDKK